MKKYFLYIILSLIIIFTDNNIVFGKSGCCSHHGGVAGCNSSGRQVCRDGTLSPSCTCTPSVTYVYGCTDSSAKNYNSSANKDDGSCTYYKYECTDTNSINYDQNAEKDDGSCISIIYGCMDEKAINYDQNANKDDNSCTYEQQEIDSEDTISSTFSEENISTQLNDEEDKNGKENDGVNIIDISIIGAVSYFFLKKMKKI